MSAQARRVPASRCAALLGVLLLGGCSAADAPDPRPAAPASTPATPEPTPVTADVLVHAADVTLAVGPNHVLTSTVLEGPQARHVQEVEGRRGQAPGSWSAVLDTTAPARRRGPSAGRAG